MLGRYSAPDQLPNEGYGFECDDDEEDDEEESDDSSRKKSSGPIKSTSGEFTFEFFEANYDLGPNFALLYGKMVSVSDNVIVGRLCGDLVTRDQRSRFYGMCDDRSQELIDLARFCANADGSLRQPLRAKIKDEARIRAAGKGGLLFLDEVHILPAFRGRDLALEFVLALLRYLRGRWTLAISVVVPWDHADQQEGNSATKRTDEERTRLCRHFARLGLKQVGDTYWYLERSQLPQQPPLPRGAVATLAVYHPAESVEPPKLSELNQKLATAVERASYDSSSYGSADANPLDKVREALEAGASIEETCALHFAVGPSGSGMRWRPDALHLLVAARADIQQVDFNGHSPLHIAANARSEPAVRALLEYGADALLGSARGGMTPQELHRSSVTAHFQSMQDFCSTFDYARNRPPSEETEDARRTRELPPCSLLLQQATAARSAQHEARACLVQCLMYWRGAHGQTLSVDVLSKIHAMVAPLRLAQYPPLTGLLPAGTPVFLGALSRASLNGQAGSLLGTDAPTGRYMVSIRGGSIKVKPENVLPVDRVDEADEGEDEEEDLY